MAKNRNLEELQAQADFMREVLEESRETLRKEPLIVEYNNGGGQMGTRENPLWTAYEKVLKSYHATLRAIDLQQGTKLAEKSTGIGSPLRNFRGKYNNIEVVKRA